MIEESKPVLPR